MSTKTTFKRVALVAVAALGLGVLSVAPSSATLTNVAISTPVAGSATFISGTSGAVSSDTTTAATLLLPALSQQLMTRFLFAFMRTQNQHQQL